jgi:hypothetical protein
MNTEEQIAMSALASSISGFEEIFKDIRNSYHIESQMLTNANKYKKPALGPLYRRIALKRRPRQIDESEWMQLVSWRKNKDVVHRDVSVPEKKIQSQEDWTKNKKRGQEVQ